MNQTLANHISRFTLGLTFIFVSVMIFQDPMYWAGFIDPWAVKLIPMSLPALMISTAVLDLLIGLLLVINRFVWIAALVGALHLLGVLVAAGIDTITVRDIGLFGDAAALALLAIPPKFFRPKKIAEPAPDFQALIKSQDEVT